MYDGFFTLTLMIINYQEILDISVKNNPSEVDRTRTESTLEDQVGVQYVKEQNTLRKIDPGPQARAFFFSLLFFYFTTS